MTTQPNNPRRQSMTIKPKADSTVPRSAVKRNPPGGSRKGRPNKVTKALKEMIQDALTEVGGSDYLVKQAEENPTAFMTLLGRTLPKDLNLDAKGPVTVIVETGVPRG